MQVRGYLHILATLSPGKNSSTHWMRCWVGSRVGLHILEKRKISLPYWDSNPKLSSQQHTHHTHYTTQTILLLAFQKFLEPQRHFTLKMNTDVYVFCVCDGFISETLPYRHSYSWTVFRLASPTQHKMPSIILTLVSIFPSSSSSSKEHSTIFSHKNCMETLMSNGKMNYLRGLVNRQLWPFAIPQTTLLDAKTWRLATVQNLKVT